MFRFGDPGGRAYGTLGASNANISAWWSSILTSINLWSIVSGGGRNTGSCLRVNGSGSTNNYCHLLKVLDSQSTWGIAFALKITGFPTFRTEILTIEDAGTVQVGLFLNTDGTLQIERGGGIGLSAGGTLIGSPSVSISINSWNHFELKVTINNTTGSIALYKNGSAIIGPTSSLNTRSSTNNSANSIRIGSVGIPGNNGIWSTPSDWDDIIIYDGQTTDPQGNPDIVGPIGDCALAWLLPTGAGTTTQFTPDSGSNYARVNEATPDGDTSYVADATVNDIDTYSLADLGGTVATVKSIITAHFAKKDDTGTRTFVSMIRTASTNFAGANVNGLSTSYQYYFNNWGSNPSSLAAWSVSDINGLEIGQKVNS